MEIGNDIQNRIHKPKVQPTKRCEREPIWKFEIGGTSDRSSGKTNLRETEEKDVTTAIANCGELQDRPSQS